ncbi:MAG: Gfo/Idh/MocA family oxidoreductase [Clostridiales bacterium]|nr:Gfo/Idh/MocA family oxidoreductase [Clostridiales bacterium]MDO4350732.1 Gfo/Idh/MocA family oxidoreductase [Eubacteriales bacterium]MDY4009019.1 Gfo/Idh/MocA family oxidoreductase [Candidatus Limiplasma sp.]
MDMFIGFIGCGCAAQTAYAPACAAHAGCVPAAWYDPDEARAAALARTYGGRVFQSMEALLACDIQAVMIDLPIARRVPAICAALKAGRYALCEPPFTMDFDGVWALTSCMFDAPGRLMPAGGLRLARASQAGCEIGGIQSFEASYTCPRPAHAASAMESPAIAAIGALHALLGEPFTDVCAMESPSRADTHLLLCTDSRVTGQLHAGWHGQPGGRVRVYGGGGQAEFALEPVPLRDHADAFLCAVKAGAPLPEDASASLAAHQVALLARRSATEGKRLYVRHG